MALVRTSILYCLIILGGIIFGISALLCEDYREIQHGYAVIVVNTQNFPNQNSDLFNTVVNSVQGNNSNNFEAIFDGETLNGWQMSGEGDFIVDVNDNSLQSQGGPGSLWFSAKKYKDFILELDWKVSQKDDNSGVFVRFPSPDEERRVEAREGYEIQIHDNAENSSQQTGAIYDIAASSQVVSKPARNWNTMMIRVIDQLYTVFINGHKVLDFVGNRSAEGYIGLQAHDDQSLIAFRNIMIQEIK
jgi:cytochrome c